MRKIKFRGLRVDGKGWVYGYLSRIEDATTWVIVDWVNKTFYHIIPTTVGQFTGLKDVNGVDIYEGDVLKETRLNGIELYYKVFYKKGGLVINTHQDDFNKSTELIFFYESIADMQNSGFIEALEVIGNIHENNK